MARYYRNLLSPLSMLGEEVYTGDPSVEIRPGKLDHINFPSSSIPPYLGHKNKELLPNHFLRVSELSSSATTYVSTNRSDN